jgi:hypothetical protein
MQTLEEATLLREKTVPILLGETPYHAGIRKPEAASVSINGEPWVGIRNVDGMPPFLMSIVSNGDFWLFVGSNTPFAAGRADPDHAIFPYRTADKILYQPGGSGVRTVFLVERGNGWALWEPWQGGGGAYVISRNLYKNVSGTAVNFEEINEDLGLRFSWRLTTSEAYGLVRFCTLENLNSEMVRVRYLDGWNQIIPPGVSQEIYERFGYLAAAYMRHERHQGLGIYTLNSGMTDRAEPCESLRAACAWSLGHSRPVVLLSERQVANFCRGIPVAAETEVRGEFGAWLVNDSVSLPAHQSHDWVTVADTGLDHRALEGLRARLESPDALRKALEADVAANRDGLRKRIAAADGLQQTADEPASVHHFANVLFNCMRGGTLADSYRVPRADWAAFLRSRNTSVHARQASWLEQLPAQLSLDLLRRLAGETADPQLIRLAREYLPLTFSRRHGDPSRPWNRFTIRTRDEAGNVIHDYQGNWRDIFQNWESLAQSYPACLESMLAIFLNASTADGYNPYRITRAGIDWEVENPDDPWSHIGYWSDHQIIYLLRLLEHYERFQSGRLSQALNERLFSYAHVPYEIKGFDGLARDPRHSIRFDSALHRRLVARAKELGNDAKLKTDKSGEVLLASLAEKLLVPLLAKLSNFVPGGGVWLNTQRPEWNDANNALAGWGLSMVTVCYLRRYLAFLERVFAGGPATVELSTEMAAFAKQIAGILSKADCKDDAARFETVAALGRAGEQYRQAVYHGSLDERVLVPSAEVRHLLSTALHAINATMQTNWRADGMFHSYNLLKLDGGKATVSNLYLMLEGQVAVLSSGLLGPAEALSLLKNLRQSELFRADQHSYLLYPDREVPSFLSRNTLPRNWETMVPAIAALAAQGSREVIVVDENGSAHFQGDLVNAASLEMRLNQLEADPRWRPAVRQDRPALLDLWESVFHHSAFTGRSGTMFAFEGLGSIYWHMVAKLLVAAEECHHQAVESGSPSEVVDGLRAAYYDIRRGLGFTKTPEVYGAFPTDPYSHTPRHLGAQQPGMTGQVKEEILTRWAELGVRVEKGLLTFAPRLLRRSEFLAQPHEFACFDPDGTERTWKLPPESLAFTYCQLPVCYRLADAPSITVERRHGNAKTIPGNALGRAESNAIFNRTGEITRLIIEVPRSSLCD